MRTILHSDCNGFFAGVECLLNPKIKDLPVAVGGKPESRHGIILAKNEIAKKFNVKTGDTIWQAKQKCPELFICEPQFNEYKKFSKLCKEIYFDYSDQVESFGLDEAWIDVTGSKMLFGNGYEIADIIRNRIKKELGITVSIGVSFNKIFAKLGSDYKKPDAITEITKNNFKSILWPLPASALMFVGHSTNRRLRSLGVYTIGDIANTPLNVLKSNFGKNGETLYCFANGYDNSPVLQLDVHEQAKSIGNSTTTPRDLENIEDVKTILFILCDSVCRRMREQGFLARTVSLSVRDNKLLTFSKQTKLDRYSNITSEISCAALNIFIDSYDWHCAIRSLGVTLSDFVYDTIPQQIDFFYDEKSRQKQERLDTVIDGLKNRYGVFAVRRAMLLRDKMLSKFNPKDEVNSLPLAR